MKPIKYYTAFFLFFFFNLLVVRAQILPANVNVEDLSNEQIVQIQNEINSRGLTFEQAAELARAQGASQLQINQLQQRLNQLVSGQTINQSSAANQSPAMGSGNVTQALSVKEEATTTEKNKQVYGYNLFNAENLTFEPSVNLPAPDDYVVGINDVITINVWGASQQNYSLTVNADGNIQIPDLGPVQVNGKELQAVRSLISNRLVAIYSGMGGSKPNTFAEISLGQLRSIKVNVIGEAITPGTYTLPATASVFNALYLSGGPNENGSFRNIRLIRDNKVLAEIDVYDYLLNANMGQNVTLRDQDIIYIPTYTTRVATGGEFKREGYFELTGDETLASLLKYAGGFTDVAYSSLLSVTRTTGKELKVIDVQDSDFNTFLLLNGDSVSAGKIIDRYENRVSIQGAVFRPGTYALEQDMHLSDLIAKAEGVKEDVFSNRGVIIRLGEDLSPMTLPFNVTDALNGKDDFILQREDQVVIRDIFSMREERFVRVYGQVQNPGQYEFKDNMSLEDLIFLSGGLTEAASESYVEISRRHDYQAASQVSDNLVELFQFDINRNLSLDEEDSAFKLKPFDYVYVRNAPSYYEQRTVEIQGEVVYPGSYSISSKTERVSDLLQRAGGISSYAYLEGATLTRKINNADEILQSVELLGDSLLEQSQEQVDNGRLELRLADILQNPGSVYDYVLKEGDVIIIPEVMEEVNVSGEVLNPIGLTYQPNKTLRYYIELAGGFSDEAKKSKVYVIYSDGTAQTSKRMLLGRSYPKVEPGSRIIVPSKPEKPAGDQTTRWLSIASAFSSLAVAIAAVLR